MDTLAKRAGVATLVMVATVGSAFALGLGRLALRDTPVLKLEAALKVPESGFLAAMTPSKAPPSDPEARKPGLAPASGKALGTAPKRPTAPPKAVQMTEAATVRSEPELPLADDLLDFGPGANDREAKLSGRGAKAFTVRQPGGVEELHPAVKDSGERVTFETDLGRPGDH
jgi:hypothetical protein